jgi:hypothetical protein
MAQCTTAQERARRYAIGLIVAHLVLALAAVLLFTTGFQDYKWPRWQSIFLEALALSQVGLATTVLVIGNFSLVWRIAVAAIVLMFWLGVLDSLDFRDENWLFIFAIQMAGIGACLAVARIFGARLTCEPATDVGSLECAKLRFSMRQILQVTAAVSFLLGIATLIGKLPDFHEALDRGVLPRAKTLGVVLVPIVLVTVWAAFTTGRRMTPFLLLIVVTLLAAYAIANTDRMFRTAWWSSLTRESYQMAYLYLVFVYALVVSLSLAILRIGGYRFDRRSGSS